MKRKVTEKPKTPLQATVDELADYFDTGDEDDENVIKYYNRLLRENQGPDRFPPGAQGDDVCSD